MKLKTWKWKTIHNTKKHNASNLHNHFLRTRSLVLLTATDSQIVLQVCVWKLRCFRNMELENVFPIVKQSRYKIQGREIEFVLQDFNDRIIIFIIEIGRIAHMVSFFFLVVYFWIAILRNLYFILWITYYKWNKRCRDRV